GHARLTAAGGAGGGEHLALAAVAAPAAAVAAVAAATVTALGALGRTAGGAASRLVREPLGGVKLLFSGREDEVTPAARQDERLALVGRPMPPGPVGPALSRSVIAAAGLRAGPGRMARLAGHRASGWGSGRPPRTFAGCAEDMPGGSIAPPVRA